MNGTFNASQSSSRHGVVVAVAAWIASALVPAALPSMATAQDCVDYRDHVQYLDLTGLPQRPSDIAVSGDFVYVAGSTDLHVVDLAAPGGPALVATLHERAFRLDLQLPYLYVSGNEFKVIDVTDPFAPRVVGRLTTPRPAGEVAVQGDHAFVFQEGFPSNPNLLVVDVSDPNAPALAAAIGEPYLADRFVISHHYLYALSSATFLIFDISNPVQPVMVGTFGGLGFPWDIAVSGDYVFVSGTTDWANGLQVYDATDVTNPRFVTYLPISNAVGLDVSGDLAVLTTFTGDLPIVDISDPEHPSLLATPAAHFSWDVILQDGVAYLPVDSALERLHIGNGRWVEAVGRVQSPDAIDVDVAGEHAYLLDRIAGLRVVDLVDVGAPKVIGALLVGAPSGISVGPPYAYVANGNQGLLTVDISDPTNPRLAGLLAGGAIGTDVALLGQYAILASTTGLVIADVNNPSAPYVAGHLDMPALEAVAVRGTYAFGAANTAGLFAIDLSDPKAPAIADQLDTPGIAHDVVLDGGLAYVADQNGVAIIDVSDPSALVLKAVYPTSGQTHGATGGESLLYAGDSELGFICLDVSIPEEPRFVGRAELAGPLQRGLVAGQLVFAAALTGGLEILPAHCRGLPAAVAELPVGSASNGMAVGLAAPNPLRRPWSTVSIPFDLRQPSMVRCAVFDVHGRLVQAVLRRWFDQGTQVASWNGLSEAGQRAPAGVYFMRLSMGEETVTRRVVLTP